MAINTPTPNLKTPMEDCVDDFVLPAMVPVVINELNILPILFQLMHHSFGNFKIEFLFFDKLSQILAFSYALASLEEPFVTQIKYVRHLSNVSATYQIP